MSERAIKAPPCPTCSATVVSVNIKSVSPEYDFLDPDACIMYSYTLVPCGHYVDGYTATTDEVLTWGHP